MITSRLAVLTCFAIFTAGASANSGELSINDWAAVDNGGQHLSMSRAEVEAELGEAQRLGLLSVGEGAFPEASSEQEQSIQHAKRQAAEQYAKSTESEG